MRRYDDVVREVLQQDGVVRLVGVDGCGGAGKTTFAERLAHAAGGCPVVHTDDVASFDEPIEWWPRMLDDIVQPLLHGREARFRRYDWSARRFTDEIVVAPAPIVVIEGVGATRAAWREALALGIWVETPRPERLRRGLDRDGAHMAEFWAWWMAAEDRYVAEEQPQLHADFVVDGTAADQKTDTFVVVSERQRGDLRSAGPR